MYHEHDDDADDDDDVWMGEEAVKNLNQKCLRLLKCILGNPINDGVHDDDDEEEEAEEDENEDDNQDDSISNASANKLGIGLPHAKPTHG